MSDCREKHPDLDIRCRMEPGPHVMHSDGHTFWDNEAGIAVLDRRPRAGARDQAARDALAIQQSQRKHEPVSVEVDALREAAEKRSKDEWYDHALDGIERAARERTEFTLEEAWKFIDNPPPFMGKRSMSTVVRRAKKARFIFDTDKSVRVRHDWMTRDGYPFPENKRATIYGSLLRS